MRVAIKFLAIVGIAYGVSATAHATLVTLPDSCGKDSVEFRVTTTKNNAIPTAEPGKALVVFIETVVDDAHVTTARFAVDGEWMGAARGTKTFAAFQVPAGNHHICAVRQSGIGADKADPGVGTVALQAGQTYYFEFKITKEVIGALGRGDGGAGGSVGAGAGGGTPDMTAKEGASIDAASFVQLSAPAGQALVRKSKQSFSTVK